MVTYRAKRGLRSGYEHFSFLKELIELLQPCCALLSVYLNATEKTSSLLLFSSGCSLSLSGKLTEGWTNFALKGGNLH